MSVKNPDDLNKDDKFIDADSAYEASYDDIDSSEQVSDEWSDDDQSDIDDRASQDLPKKKKKKSNFFIILGVVLVAILGLIFIAGGGDAPVNQPVDETQAAVATNATDTNDIQPQEPPVIVEDTSISQSVPEQTGLLNDQNVVDKVEMTTQGLPTDTPSQIQPSIEPTPQLDSQVVVSEPNMGLPSDNSVKVEQNKTDIVNIVTPDIKSVSDFPTADTIKKSDSGQVESIPSPTEIEGSEESNVADLEAVSDADPKKLELAEKLSTAEKRITDLEKTLSEKEVELNNQKALTSPQDSSEEINSLKEKIEELESKLIVSSREGVAESSSKPSEDTIHITKDLSIVTSSKIATPEVKRAPVWALRSANSTKAVILDKLTGDIRTVVVGDVVQGLGRIQSISEQNSLWVVNGSKSKLSE